MKIGFKFQSLGKISNILAADPPVLLGQFQHCLFSCVFVIVFYAFTFVLCNKDLLTYLLSNIATNATDRAGNDHSSILYCVFYRRKNDSTELAAVACEIT